MITADTVRAAGGADFANIPLSEIQRKLKLHEGFTTFHQAIKAAPSLIMQEFNHHLKFYD